MNRIEYRSYNITIVLNYMCVEITFSLYSNDESRHIDTLWFWSIHNSPDHIKKLKSCSGGILEALLFPKIWVEFSFKILLQYAMTDDPCNL